MSLFHLEHDLLLGQFQDPRIHVMLNCASRGCPPLRYWKRKNLNEQLDLHWKYFVRESLQPTPTGWGISELFFWYEKDFLQWSRSSNLCVYLLPYAQDGAKDWLIKHKELCPLSSFPYDWSLND